MTGTAGSRQTDAGPKYPALRLKQDDLTQKPLKIQQQEVTTERGDGGHTSATSADQSDPMVSTSSTRLAQFSGTTSSPVWSESHTDFTAPATVDISERLEELEIRYAELQYDLQVARSRNATATHSDLSVYGYPAHTSCSTLEPLRLSMKSRSNPPRRFCAAERGLCTPKPSLSRLPSRRSRRIQLSLSLTCVLKTVTCISGPTGTTGS